MIYIVNVLDESNSKHPLFVMDDVTGQTAKDIITIPGIYNSVVSSDIVSDLYFTKVQGRIGNYITNMYCLEVNSQEVVDITADVSRFISLPATALPVMFDSVEENLRNIIKLGIDSVKFYESIKDTSKVCVPVDAFKNIDDSIVNTMSSVRTSYSLKNTDNQSIFQKSPTDFYCIHLPNLESLHYNAFDALDALDILRVIAPYRKEERPGIYSYKGIYHTPYYKVDTRLRGMVPSYLEWIDGYSSNNQIAITSNERQMANNLRTFICSDISRYIVEMMSGIFFDTQIGSLLSKLATVKDEDLILHLLEDIKLLSDDKISCIIPFSEIEELRSSNWVSSSVITAIKKNLYINEDALEEILKSRPGNRKVITCDNLPFLIKLTDVQEQKYTEYMIANGFISSAMNIFLLELCKKAYEVNWGHTGATKAIRYFSDKNIIENINDNMSNFIISSVKNEKIEEDKFPYLFYSKDEEDEEELDEAFTGFDYYVTDETAQKISNNSLSHDFFVTNASAAQTREAAVVEYWRNINGENNIDNFISSIYLETADVNVFIESFIKLMRWGSMKPKLLILQDYKDYKYVFDLSSGQIIDNTTVVSEEDLIKVNGCDYSFTGFLCSNSNPLLDSNSIIGFLLQKNYGKVVHNYLASWLDIAEMINTSKINIGDFVTLTKVEFNKDNSMYIEEFEKEDYHIFVSEGNIQDGLNLGIKPSDLSSICLLTTPGITNTSNYLKSLKNTTLLTIKDRQYDLLRRYIDTVNKFYSAQGANINNVSSTVELADLAVEFGKIYEYTNSKRENNEVVSSNTLTKLNLAGDTNDVIEWCDDELQGKFIIISDTDMKSNLPPIEFTEQSVRDVAAKARNRIVLLLLEKDNKYIFCRKDISSQEIMLVNVQQADGSKSVKLGHKKYSMFQQLLENLTKGISVKINKLPAYLHTSLKEFI